MTKAGLQVRNFYLYNGKAFNYEIRVESDSAKKMDDLIKLMKELADNLNS
jgi:hypothetical protein